MAGSSFKQDIFNQFARAGKALGNGNRLEILEYLAQRERSVEELSNVAGLSVANTSQHLQQLRQAGLVSSRKEGLKVFYRLSGTDVIDLLNALRRFAERHIAEVEQLVETFLTVRDDLEAIPREELLERVQSNLVTVLDVRPPDEFAAGHVPGAVNVPVDELEHYLQRLSPDQDIVAYCRGPHCILAYDAVAYLRDNGFNARRMEDGFPEWRAEGRPVET